MLIIEWKKFAAAASALNKETFLVHMAYLGAKMLIYPAWKAQIALLLAKKVSVPKEYADFSDIFSKKYMAVLFNCSNINKYAINLKLGKQPPLRPIYSLGPVELKIFKTYIEANLANRFIRLFKFFVRASIFFVRKPNGSFRLYMDYSGLNNLTIKN